ncbi:MBL fold metallo-hydrolase [Corynebacterium aquilae]|uniref:Zn-dependent hydrolase n=1 Tax=Corynebacterium aquilae DSM 44791 TaxID=1431546 RepID=A0A1L7CGN9_9CORY|nr:MBL fold metallo-hydrolase [Corynebacterium aquilae]APT85017.1 Zn-dependent hydrolase [Corynebacterium aquilae DSM 44791]
MNIEHLETSGTFRLDGGEWDVDNNVYLLSGKEGVYIVDPAHDKQAIIDAVGDRKVLAVLLTHAHNDHCDLVPEIVGHYGAPAYLHPDDDMLWKESNGDATYLPLNDGRHFELDGQPIITIHTPGHSPGCVVFHIPSENTLISGDTLFNGGPGATGRKYSDFDTIIESLRTRVFTLDADTTVLPGHGDNTTVGAEAARLDEYIQRGY